MLKPDLCRGALWLTLALASSVRAESLLGEPPARYRESLEARLTSLETAKSLPKAPDQEASSGAETLLNEHLLWAHEDGREVSALHVIRGALTEAGAELLHEASINFAATRERITLVSARTIQPDGSSIPVQDGAAFLRKSSDSGSRTHGDGEQLKVVFSDVRKGSLIEYLAVIEDAEPTIPGHFTRSKVWGSNDAIRRIRIAVDLPGNLARALHWHAQGLSLAEPEREDLADGRTLFSWQSDRLAPVPYDSGAPAVRHVGPVLRMSTLADWDAFGSWYAGLLRQRDTISAEWKAKAEEAVKGAASPREMAAKLHAFVCNEVRYTGLEFGQGALQPRAPDEVMTSRFGDCKDKANLLRLLLRERGVASRFALLNSEFSGEIHRLIPSVGRFDHAVLAVDLPGEVGPIWSDPSVEGMPFGEIVPGRDVLAIGPDGKTEWLRTPVVSQGDQVTTGELEMGSGGRLSGWLTMEASGMVAGLVSRQLATQDRASTLELLERGVFLGLAQGKVIDFEKEERADEKARHVLRVRGYTLKLGANVNPQSTTERLAFPTVGLFQVRVAKTAERASPLAGVVRRTRNVIRFTPPRDWVVLDLPTPFEREAAGYKVSARWKQEEGVLIAEGAVTGSKVEISAAEHRKLWELDRDFRAWRENVALLKRPAKTGKDDSKDSGRVTGENLPRMFSSLGQKALIEAHFPLDPQNPLEANHPERAKAFAKMAEFFSEDPLGHFEASLGQALSELMEGEEDKAIEKCRQLMDRHGKNLSSDQLASGKILLAGALNEKRRFQEALRWAVEVADDEALAPIKRQAGAAAGAYACQFTDPARSLKYARQALEFRRFPDESLSDLVGITFRSLATDPSTTLSQVTEEWRTLLSKQKARENIVREAVIAGPADLMHLGRLNEAQRLADFLTELGKSENWPGDSRKEVSDSHDTLRRASASEPAHSYLKRWLARHPWPDLNKTEPDVSADSAEECAIMAEDEEYPIQVRYLLRAMVSFGPQAELRDYAESAADAVRSWMKDLADEVDNTPAAPVELGPLLEALMIAWEMAPCSSGG